MKKSKREEVLRLLEADRSRSDAAIAKEAGCVTSYVYSIRKQTRGRAEIYAKEAEWIKALLLDPTFESYQQVAKKVGCGSGYVRAIDEQLTAESTAAATSVSVPATGLSAEVKRSYVETNDLPPAPVEVVTRSRFLVPPNRTSRGIDKQTTVMQRITSRGSLGTGHCIRVLR